MKKMGTFRKEVNQTLTVIVYLQYLFDCSGNFI